MTGFKAYVAHLIAIRAQLPNFQPMIWDREVSAVAMDARNAARFAIAAHERTVRK